MIDWALALPLIIGILGLATLIFTALRYGRDDTTAVVNQQAQITAEMKTLNDELRDTADRLRAERDELRAANDRQAGQIAELHAMTAGKVARLEDARDG